MIRELKGWHVGAMMLGFFGITIAVNVLFTTYAISTFSGEDVAKPYLRGLAYNETLAARAAQAALNWKASIGVSQADGKATLTVTIADSSGGALSSLDVEATLRRPTDARLDRTVGLQAIGGGAYRAELGVLAAGQWDVIARAKDDAHSFEAERRVVLK